MLDRRTASAIIALTWFVDGACAQQTASGAIPPPAPALAPAPEGAATAEATVNDDPTDSVNWRDRVTAARQRHDDWAACVAANFSLIFSRNGGRIRRAMIRRSGIEASTTSVSLAE
jgi:hypothetical protein